MRCAAPAFVALLLCAGGCVYSVKLVPPHITASDLDAPGAAVFAIAAFKDERPEKPHIGDTIQHCIMDGILVFGPISHKSRIPPEKLIPETLAVFMKERGFNTRITEDPLAGDADYVITGTIREFHFSTPSADFVPAKMRVAWTAAVIDARGRKVLQRRIDATGTKLLGFGTNSFFNIEPFVRKTLYDSIEQFLASEDLQALLWRVREPDG